MIRLARRLRHWLGLPAPTPRPAVELGALVSREAARWDEARRRAQDGPRVLIATSVGGFTPATTLEGLLAIALTLRGANVHFLLCDAALPACLNATEQGIASHAHFVRDGPQHELCHGCVESGGRTYGPLGLPIHRYGELLDTSELDRAREMASEASLGSIASFTSDGQSMGEHALAGALRYYARGELPSSAEAASVLRRYFEAAILTSVATTRLLERLDFASAVFHHGIYVPQGLIGEVARAKRVSVVNWHVAYRRRRFIFSHRDSYHHTLLEEPTSNWSDCALSPNQERELMSYLKSRWRGTEDWIGFHERPLEDAAEVKKLLNIEPSRPCVGMLTNVVWDARLHYRANAFRDIVEWAICTVEYFARRPDLQLLIRVHPAEVRGTLVSRQPIEPEIRRAFDRLPDNVTIIPASSRMSTYAAMLQCDSVLIYGTKMGVELTALGIPVIVAGEAWIKNKGLTLDANSADEYLALLDRLPARERMKPEQVERARRYAYHFFFRRMIPVTTVEPVKGFPPYRVSARRLADLEGGHDIGLKVICDGILEGREFVYPAEAIEVGP